MLYNIWNDITIALSYLRAHVPQRDGKSFGVKSMRNTPEGIQVSPLLPILWPTVTFNSFITILFKSFP
jgi:hypothetical protein